MMPLLSRTLLVQVPGLDQVHLLHSPHILHWFLSISRTNLHSSWPKKMRSVFHSSRHSCDAADEHGSKLGVLCLGCPTVTSRQPADVATHNTPGQRVWLSTWDLPLKVESCNLVPRFVDPFPITKVVNLMAITLKLLKFRCNNPTFHVSKVKPVKSSISALFLIVAVLSLALTLDQVLNALQPTKI